MKRILGISAFYHDSAAALLVDGEVVAAAQEERFTRKKHTADFPEHAVRYCLEEAGLTIDELDAVVFYDKPLLKFERLLETYYAFAPSGLLSFLKAVPVWLGEKLFLKKQLYDGLKEIDSFDKKRFELLFPEHHLSHAASAFYASPFEKAAILTIDGVGEWATATIGVGEGNTIKLLREMRFPHSVGLLYSAFTYFLGFKVNSGEYKLMGLAPFGDSDSAQTKEFEEIIRDNLVEIKPDGSIWLDQRYFNYATGLRMIKATRWQQLFGFGVRQPEAALEQRHCNLALAVQRVTEDIVLKMAATAQELTGAENLCMAGGVALNSVANGKLLQSGLFKGLYIQPAAGDAGGALGAAWAVHHMHYREPRTAAGDRMQGAYLGPQFRAQDLEKLHRQTVAVGAKYAEDELMTIVAEELAAGKVVGWFQGRMEFGPRALGNRSILGDPRNPQMQQQINQKIKFRESFRPFAPAVLAEDASDWFELDGAAPYMQLVVPVKDQHRKEVPKADSISEQLAQERSRIPAVTHVDYSARVQTVHAETNPRFHKLLQAFKARTGCGMLINTSFNVRGEPIVCTPEDAYRCFMDTHMDVLVINDTLYRKADQPTSGKQESKPRTFQPD